jgi:hypothetical protein
MVPIQPETTHVVGRVFDIHPSVGKWETLVGEGGFFLGDGGDLDMVGGEEGWVWKIVMWFSRKEERVVFLWSKMWFEWGRGREREGPLGLFLGVVGMEDLAFFCFLK